MVKKGTRDLVTCFCIQLDLFMDVGGTPVQRRQKKTPATGTSSPGAVTKSNRSRSSEDNCMGTRQKLLVSRSP